VRQAHELDELEESLRCVLQPHRAAPAQRSELEARERIDGHRICVDARHVAVDDNRCALREDSTDAIAQSRKIGATDRAADSEGDLVRPRSGHRSLDGRNPRN